MVIITNRLYDGQAWMNRSGDFSNGSILYNDIWRISILAEADEKAAQNAVDKSKEFWEKGVDIRQMQRDVAAKMSPSEQATALSWFKNAFGSLDLEDNVLDEKGEKIGDGRCSYKALLGARSCLPALIQKEVDAYIVEQVGEAEAREKEKEDLEKEEEARKERLLMEIGTPERPPSGNLFKSFYRIEYNLASLATDEATKNSSLYTSTEKLRGEVLEALYWSRLQPQIEEMLQGGPGILIIAHMSIYGNNH